MRSKDQALYDALTNAADYLKSMALIPMPSSYRDTNYTTPEYLAACKKAYELITKIANDYKKN